MPNEVTREDIEKLNKKIDEVKDKIADQEKISTSQHGRLNTIERFLFGNGVEGLVTIIERLRKSLSEFRKDFELWKKAENVEAETEDQKESRHRAVKGLRLRTIGIWFTGISMFAVVVFNVLNVFGVG